MTQVVFAAIDKGGQSHIWLARLDRQLPPRQLSSIVSDGPRFGTSDEIFSRVTEGSAALSFVYRTKLDGSEPQKVVATPVLFFMSASPDGAWVTAQMPGSVGSAGDTLAFPTAGGMPEVVADGRTGILVPPRDHTAMAEALIRLLSDAALRAEMGAAGVARARARFSAERMVQDTLDVYKRVAPMIDYLCASLELEF